LFEAKKGHPTSYKVEPEPTAYNNTDYCNKQESKKATDKFLSQYPDPEPRYSNPGGSDKIRKNRELFTCSAFSSILSLARLVAGGTILLFHCPKIPLLITVDASRLLEITKTFVTVKQTLPYSQSSPWPG
jgi:hypothetical protein